MRLLVYAAGCNSASSNASSESLSRNAVTRCSICFARVDIRLRDGRVLQSTLTEARGDPEAPLSDDELREKFEALAVPVLGATRAKQIEQRVTALRDSDSLDALLDALLQPAA